ncbi:splicing factor, suppressor of white-apricot homolog isoform X1 [Rhopilema esculentum]|uniref:splicing factor, suppressor of white-apricot homolog isoform X1 n=2 Tax=Rhopilema esculentum TaxID=499914 RepID=UPI0031CF29ED
MPVRLNKTPWEIDFRIVLKVIEHKGLDKRNNICNWSEHLCTVMSFLVNIDSFPPYKRKKFEDDKRHPQPRNKYEDVIVIGYHSKLFRDDAMAQYIEDGKHLIPWMGDESLLIDRYDCRGHLYSRDEFEWKSSQLTMQLSSEEEQIEKACDEERYMGIHKDVEEENFLEEEEEKRLSIATDPASAAYRNVGFSYQSTNHDGSKEYDPNDCFKDDSDEENGIAENIAKISRVKNEGKLITLGGKLAQPSAKPVIKETEAVGVYIKPVNLEIPSGIDVPDSQKSHSIIEKTALFISKQGTQMEIVLKAKQAGNPQFDFLNYGNWLNPYYKLILQKIKDGGYTVEPATTQESSNQSDNAQPTVSSSSDGEGSDDDEYIHPLLQAHRRPIKTTAEPTKSQQTVSESHQQQTRHIPASLSYETTGIQTVLPPNTYSDAVAVYMARKYRNKRHDTPSPKKNNDNNEDQEAADEHWADDLEEDQSNAVINAQNLAYFNQMQLELAQLHPAYMMTSLVPPPPPPGQEEQPGTAEPNPSIYAMQLPPPPPPPGCSESGIEDRSFANQQQQQHHIVPPPPDLKVVVDKLADYVSRNGETFEEQVKKKKDFDFLKSDNIYYPYYLYKKQQCILEVSVTKAQKKKEEEEKATKPLSFALKTKKVTKAPVVKSKAVEIFKKAEEEAESDEDMEEVATDLDGYRPNFVKKKEESKENEPSMEEKAKDTMEKAKRMIAEAQKRQKELQQQCSSSEVSARNSEGVNPEKQAQMERRRKAAAFIGMLKQSNSSDHSSSSSDDESGHSSSDSNESDNEAHPKRHFQERRNSDD